MRVLAINSFRRILGGAENYLAGVLPALQDRGHEVALAFEVDGPEGRSLVFDGESMALAPEALATSVSRATAWRPDVLFVHGLSSPALLERLRSVAPIVAFAHDYAGACISGLKTWQSVPAPCARPLGPACLLHYFPHRCGGRDPRTMVRAYRLQRARQAALRRHSAIIVASAHMREEMVRQGVAEKRIHAPPMFSMGVERALAATPSAPAPRALGNVARLLFAGRLDRLKGLDLLLDALPAVAQELGRDVSLVVAGDGPERARLEARAAQGASSRARVTMAGWCDDGALAALLHEAELLVVPSVWPEPFGLVGPEAGARGVPAAAFDLGGVTSWLTDGVNGHLAPGARPDAPGIANAIVRCLTDESHWNALRVDAWRLAARFRRATHVAAVERVLAEVSAGREATAPQPSAEPAGWHETRP